MVVFFFLSSAGSEPSFQAATVELSPGQLADTLVQELEPWRGEAGLLVRRLELSTNICEVLQCRKRAPNAFSLFS